ncbi:DUF4079 domain-containing protein [Prochlorothrix hollandica]|uniref:DUF4079 domain-containing protein n=1 Tax=Prochlorothrix hollandica TaxID=1223 RepID=UPI000376CF2B
MGLTVTLYTALAVVGLGLRWQRSRIPGVSVAPLPSPDRATSSAVTLEAGGADRSPDATEIPASSGDRDPASTPDSASTPDPATDPPLGREPDPQAEPWPWLRPLHIALGVGLVLLVLGLLTIGVVGTLGHFGSLGHSPHLVMGLTVVAITLASAWSATRIGPDRPWARSLHLSLNGLLFLALALVSWTGWTVVQKYLP